MSYVVYFSKQGRITCFQYDISSSAHTTFNMVVKTGQVDWVELLAITDQGLIRFNFWSKEAHPVDLYPVDLRNCKQGQKLRSRHGMILTYLGQTVDSRYPHSVQYPNGAGGTRTHDGHVFSDPNGRLPGDHDIAEILPLEE